MATEKPFEQKCSALLVSLLTDYARQYRLSSKSSLERDCETVARRISSEGLVFLHSTLKTIQEGLLEVLENGVLPTSALPFKRSKGTCIPVFLGDYWARVIDKDGCLLANPNIFAIKLLYQVGNLFTKLELPYPDSVVGDFLDAFVKTDNAVGTYPSHIQKEWREELLSRAANLCGLILSGVDLLDIRPRHGPGAVADHQKQEGKWEFTTLYFDLDSVYSYYEYFSSGIRMFTDRLPNYAALKWRRWSKARICLVPKTTTKPRIISIEPAEKQFIQQGQMNVLVDWLESHLITKGQVNFTHQEINQQLALSSSLTKDMATIDLSDASDLVSIRLLRDLLRNDEVIFQQLMASRSAYTVLPDGREVKLKKFAPMGSATCFPVEALIFYCVSVAAISMAEPAITWRHQTSFAFVYGDDIIVPSYYVDEVIRGLTAVGLKVNTLKSYWKGHFRESCGMHAYNGHDITPIRVKKVFPLKRGDGQSITTWLSYAHAFDKQGLVATAELIYSWVEDLVKEILPFGTSDCGYLCRHASSNDDARLLNSHSKRVKRRWNKDLQRWEFLVLALRTRKRDVRFEDNWNRLLERLTSPSTVEDPSKTVLARSVQIKRAWRA